MENDGNFAKLQKYIFFEFVIYAVFVAILARVHPKRRLLRGGGIYYISLYSNLSQQGEGGRGVINSEKWADVV